MTIITREYESLAVAQWAEFFDRLGVSFSYKPVNIECGGKDANPAFETLSAFVKPDEFGETRSFAKQLGEEQTVEEFTLFSTEGVCDSDYLIVSVRIKTQHYPDALLRAKAEARIDIIE